jgi:hypothetical protein
MVANSAVLVNHTHLWLLHWNVSVRKAVNLRLVSGLSELRLMSGLSKLLKTNISIAAVFLLQLVRDIIL